ncbi:terpene synthase family protein [Pseudonocardia acaciae]|uniref:terpene synthase family protein n=1 Tax=Pseudonocardia acaciae TaxID=551276 RepID=UPI0007E8E1AD|nr:hypothetical protein [Pseudonocardia acaciae]
MRAFILPEFQLAHPARRNPHLERARAHGAAWARRMGMLDAAVWDDEALERMDFALLGAHAHPDCDGPTLELVTEWYLWAFFVDDHVAAHFTRPRDPAGARDVLDRLDTFLTGDSPEPGNPAEAGLADLWERTASLGTAGWRRFTKATRNLIVEARWKLANIDVERIPNPVEYAQVRGRFGVGRWAAALVELVELAAGVEVPDELAGSEPMRSLVRAFADAAQLRNDLFSYQREVWEEGENANAVRVFERFFDCSTQRAAELVNGLLTARMARFEEAALAGPPAGCVNALRDWQAGWHEWHARSSRYMNDGYRVGEPRRDRLGGPTGPGTPGLRLTPLPGTQRPSRGYPRIPFQPVGPLPLPKLHMPYPFRTGRHLDATRRHTVDWARRMGMFDAVPGCPGGGLWDERRFLGLDVAHHAAMIHADADAERLALHADWLAWGAYADDYLPAAFGASGDLAGAGACHERLAAFLPLDGERAPEPANPLERGLADLWRRTPGDTALRDAVLEMTASWVWELDNQERNRIPDPLDYVETRRRTSGAELAMLLAGIPGDLPPELRDTRVVRELRTAAQDYACFTNDLFSYQKEVELEGDVHNLVLVLENFLEVDRWTARDLTSDLMTARVGQFEHLAGHELPALAAQLNLGPPARAALDRHVQWLRDWMAGTLEWHRHCERYSEHELRRRVTRSTGGWLPELSEPPEPPGPVRDGLNLRA